MFEHEFRYKCECIRIIDGDTLELRVDLGFSIAKIDKFRLYGINAPETYGVSKLSEEYQKGLNVINRVKELIASKNLIVKTYQDKKDKYGRYLAEILIQDGENLINLNQQLLSEQLVEIYV